VGDLNFYFYFKKMRNSAPKYAKGYGTTAIGEKNCTGTSI
jgi:hypothetical protein